MMKTGFMLACDVFFLLNPSDLLAAFGVRGFGYDRTSNVKEKTNKDIKIDIKLLRCRSLHLLASKNLFFLLYMLFRPPVKSRERKRK